MTVVKLERGNADARIVKVHAVLAALGYKLKISRMTKVDRKQKEENENPDPEAYKFRIGRLTKIDRLMKDKYDSKKLDQA